MYTSRWKRWLFQFITADVLKMQIAIWLIVIELLAAVGGFMWLEGYSLIDALYMTVITISTVGYGEVAPLSDAGKIFTSVLIVVNIGVFTYTATAFTYWIVQGALFHKMWKRDMERRIQKLQDHVIVVGYGRFGREVAQHLREMDIPFVVVEKDPEVVEELKRDPMMLFVEGDATSDEVLRMAGIEQAKAFITAVHDDTTNLYGVLSARHINQKLNIISRAQDNKSAEKLRLAGASHVVLPMKIGGFYMAALVTRPDAVEFLSVLAKEPHAEITFEEYHYDELPEPFRDKSIRDLNFRNRTGVNIIAVRMPDGTFVVNPSPDTPIVAGSSIIVIGTKEQIERMLELIPKVK